MKNIKDLMPVGADDEMGRRKGEDIRTYNQKVILYKRALAVEKTDSILKALESAAVLGHTKAMVALGRYYSKSDAELSNKWFTKAADEGNEEAKAFLKKTKAKVKANAPKTEAVVEKKLSENEIQAQKEKLKAKQKAEADKALKSLLSCGCDDVMGRRRGEGVREYNKKVTLYTRALSLERPTSILNALIEAAEAGHTKAMVALGKYYREFEPMESQRWLAEAAERDNQEAVKLLESFSDCAVSIDIELELVLSSGKKYREIIDKKYKVSKNDPPYLKDFKRIAEGGNPYALLWLSRYYSSRSVVWSIDYLVCSCEKGYDVAIQQLFKDKEIESFSLGEQYVKLFLKLANINNCYVNYQLHRIYTEDKYRQMYNLDVTPEFAFEMLLNSDPPNNSNIKKAIYIKIGKCYENGIGVEKNIRKAREYYKDYDGKKYAELTEWINAEGRYQQVVAEEAKKREKLIAEHSNPVFEDFKKRFPSRVASIEMVQRKLDPSVLKRQLELRNKLLGMGYTIDQMYEYGNFIGDRLLRKIENDSAKKDAPVKVSVVSDNIPISIDEEDYERDPDPRIDFFNKISRRDKKQNVFLLPFVKTNNKPGGYGLINRYTYCPPLGQYEITHIYINGVLLNQFSEITPVSFSLKPGVYDMKITARYVCTPDLDSDNLEGRTIYKNEKKDFDKTRTFEYKGFRVNEDDVVRLAFRAYIIIEWEKEIYEFGNNPQNRFDIMRYGDWKYNFYELRPYTVSELMSITDDVSNWDIYTTKPFDPRVRSFEAVKKAAEKSYYY